MPGPSIDNSAPKENAEIGNTSPLQPTPAVENTVVMEQPTDSDAQNGSVALEEATAESADNQAKPALTQQKARSWMDEDTSEIQPNSPKAGYNKASYAAAPCSNGNSSLDENTSDIPPNAPKNVEEIGAADKHTVKEISVSTKRCDIKADAANPLAHTAISLEHLVKMMQSIYRDRDCAVRNIVGDGGSGTGQETGTTELMQWATICAKLAEVEQPIKRAQNVHPREKEIANADYHEFNSDLECIILRAAIISRLSRRQNIIDAVTCAAEGVANDSSSGTGEEKKKKKDENISEIEPTITEAETVTETEAVDKDVVKEITGCTEKCGIISGMEDVMLHTKMAMSRLQEIIDSMSCAAEDAACDGTGGICEEKKNDVQQNSGANASG